MTPEQQRAARAAYLLGFGSKEAKPEFRSKAQRRASKAARGFFGDPSKKKAVR